MILCCIYAGWIEEFCCTKDTKMQHKHTHRQTHLIRKICSLFAWRVFVSTSLWRSQQQQQQQRDEQRDIEWRQKNIAIYLHIFTLFFFLLLCYLFSLSVLLLSVAPRRQNLFISRRSSGLMPAAASIRLSVCLCVCVFEADCWMCKQRFFRYSWHWPTYGSHILCDLRMMPECICFAGHKHTLALTLSSLSVLLFFSFNFFFIRFVWWVWVVSVRMHWAGTELDMWNEYVLFSNCWQTGWTLDSWGEERAERARTWVTHWGVNWICFQGIKFFSRLYTPFVWTIVIVVGGLHGLPFGIGGCNESWMVISFVDCKLKFVTVESKCSQVECIEVHVHIFDFRIRTFDLRIQTHFEFLFWKFHVRIECGNIIVFFKFEDQTSKY